MRQEEKMTKHTVDGKTYAPPTNKRCLRCGAAITAEQIFTTTCEDYGYVTEVKNEENNVDNNKYVRKVHRSEEVVRRTEDRVSDSDSRPESGSDGDSKKVSSKRSSKDSTSGRSFKRKPRK